MLRPGCPRCAAPVASPDAAAAAGWACAEHGPVPVLHRPDVATYDDFVEHLERAGPFPTYLPWPLGPGWQVSDFAVVSDHVGTCATATASTGSSMLDGPVDVLVVSEEPGTGLGGRVSGLAAPDPTDVGEGPALARVRVESATVPLWQVSTAAADDGFDRTVLAGEAVGRWLWIVLRPAAAVLSLQDRVVLRDVSGMGPALLELEFGGPTPPW